MLRGVEDLKALRQRYRLTQSQVAERAGVKQPEVSAVEDGVRTTPEARAQILTAIRGLARPTDGLTADIRVRMLAVFTKYGATDVRVFGSVAQGTDHPGSDIDLLAKFPDNFGLFALTALEEELEAITGIPVDVVSDSPRAGRTLVEITKTSTPLVG